MASNKTKQSRVALIGTTGVPANYGGFETLAEQLVVDDGESYTVYCEGARYSARYDLYIGAKLVYLPIKANGVASILYDLLATVHAIATGHRRLLFLGVSGALGVLLTKLIPRTRSAVNVDGIEWRRGKWSLPARWLLRALEYVAVSVADIVISDNAAIRLYITSAYGRESLVITYGGDHVCPTKAGPAEASDHFIAVARIEPENNPQLILDAFERSGSRLIFYGNWSISDYSRRLHAQYGKLENIVLRPATYDSEELLRIRSNAIAYVHGHSAGGTNPVLVEAMHIGRPIIAFDCTFNRETLGQLGDYFRSGEELVALVSKEVRSDYCEQLVNMAKDRYSWKRIAEQYRNIW